MDRDAMMKEAKDFHGPGRGYIHAEMKAGEREYLITGNAAVLIIGIGEICNAIAQSTDTSPEQVLETVKKSLHITKNNREEEEPGIYKEI